MLPNLQCVREEDEEFYSSKILPIAKPENNEYKDEQ